MKYERFLVALLAACILVMPAFSVQDNGYPTSGQYDQQKSCDCQKPCDCQKSPCGEDGKQIGPKSMMGDDGKKIVCECKVMGKDDHQKTCDDHKSMMGDQGQYDQQKSCDCQKPCDCQKSPCGEDGKQIGPKSMMGDDSKKIVCVCKVMGKDDHQKTCDDHKSMMGDQGQYDQQKSCDCQKPCDCQKSPYGEDGKQIGVEVHDGKMMARK